MLPTSLIGLLVSLGLTLSTPALENPSIDSVISEFTMGTAQPVISSSYDFQPQIDVVPSTPYPRIVPIMKVPIAEDEKPEDRGFRPAPKKFGGFEGIFQTPWAPPDPTIAVGPNHIVQTVNMTIAWYTKSGTLQFSQRLDNTGSPGFFEDVGAGNFTFDPKCTYDEHSNRFFVLALEVYSSTAYITFAVSDDNDPNGVWYKYRTDAVTTVSGTTYWVDYPGIGYDANAFYVTGNLFGLSAGGFAGAKYRVFPKAPLLSGGAATWFDLRDGNSASVQVAHCHTVPLGPFFVSAGSSTTIKIQSMFNPTTNPSLVTTTVTVPSYTGPPDAPNLGGGYLDTIDARIINVDYRNGSLLAGHSIGVGGRALARWYEFKTNNWPNVGSVTLGQSGELDMDESVYTWYPALSMNSLGEIAMTLAYSSAAEYGGIAIAVRKPGDAGGTFPLVERVKGGESSYNGRWGDYFDCTPDPSDPAQFWGIGEFARGGSWGTYIGCFDSVPAVPSTGMLISLRDDTLLGGNLYGRDDIIHLDPISGKYTLFVDLSDSLGGAIVNTDVIHVLPDDSILLSFVQTENIPGLIGGPNGTAVEDCDVVRFVPIRLGEETSGTFEFYLDGSDLGLDYAVEDVDALATDASGNLLFSVTGPWTLANGLTGKDEDILKLVATSLGSNTAGTVTLYFNGDDTDVRLGKPDEDIDAIDVDPGNGNITVGTWGEFLVPVSLSGGASDLIMFTPTLLGDDTNGSWIFVFEADNYGLTNAKLDALYIFP